MFQRLQKKWGVSTGQFWILFLVFALTGTTTAYLTRFITAWLGMGSHTWWVWKLLLRIAMLLFGYQFILLGYGAILGQWAFFWKYERRILERLGILKRKGNTGNLYAQTEIMEQGNNTSMKQVAIFASGTGTNAEKIIAHVKNHASIHIRLIVCNKPGAGVIGIAANNDIPVLMIEKERFFRGDAYLPQLKESGINFIVLAGFLWKVPDALVAAYPNKIINIHPALLPKYGGKGMYGMRVHEAVIAAGEKESGITIHYVNEHFDEGAPIFQASCPVEPGETPESLAKKIHLLEHSHFPQVVVETIQKNSR
jgi:formyltetrahydrofolate-dependent phosphoribosylglycinamide formyltransferase